VVGFNSARYFGAGGEKTRPIVSDRQKYSAEFGTVAVNSGEQWLRQIGLEGNIDRQTDRQTDTHTDNATSVNLCILGVHGGKTPVLQLITPLLMKFLSHRPQGMVQPHLLPDRGTSAAVYL